MTTEAGKHVNRPLGEDEEEVLDSIWNSLPAASEEEVVVDGYFRDARQRIRRRKVRRRVYLASAGVAAVIAILLLVVRPVSPVVEIPVVAQLTEMGIVVQDGNVQLIVDDAAVANLGEAAKIDVNGKSGVALESVDGKRIVLEQEKTLKIYVPTGKHFNLELADGTRVCLNADTWFEYPSTFDSQEERRVRITGEGFFDVRRDSTKPFFVDIPGGESIRVLGTSFNVSAYEENEENVTTLLSGKIAYHVPDCPETVHLAPNEQICINKSTRVIEKHEVKANEYAMWKEGILYFNNEKLGILAKKLARMYGIEIRVAEEYHDSCFSGMIRYERGIDYITKLLTTTSNIKCTVENGVMYFR